MSGYVWACDICGQPIKDGAGYLCVDWGEAWRRWREERREEAAAARRADAAGGRVLFVTPLSEVVSRGPVRWEAYHRACDPELERDDYWIAVERCRTLAALLDWNAHLTGKHAHWVGETDWGRFLHHRLAGGEASP